MSEEASDGKRTIVRHRWEHTSRGWDEIKLVDGALVSEAAYREREAAIRRRELRDCRRGLIRSIVLVVDLSRNGMDARDFRLERIRLIREELNKFIRTFMVQNPLSQIAIITTRESCAFVKTKLAGQASLEAQLAAVEGLTEDSATGDASLFNALRVATTLLKEAPPFSTKEVLLIYGSMATTDSVSLDDVSELVTSGETASVVSAIGFSVRCHCLEHIVKQTGGTYHVPTSPEHLNDIFNMHVLPPAWSEMTQSMKMARFGFPKPCRDCVAFDLDQIKGSSDDAMPVAVEMQCPRCGAHVLTVPDYCPVCNILLMTPGDLTQSMHHLSPLEDFKTTEEPGMVCRGCGDLLPSEHVVCNSCGSGFCQDCDKFVHECLHNCPGCMQ